MRYLVVFLLLFLIPVVISPSIYVNTSYNPNASNGATGGYNISYVSPDPFIVDTIEVLGNLTFNYSTTEINVTDHNSGVIYGYGNSVTLSPTNSQLNLSLVSNATTTTTTTTTTVAGGGGSSGFDDIPDESGNITIYSDNVTIIPTFFRVNDCGELIERNIKVVNNGTKDYYLKIVAEHEHKYEVSNEYTSQESGFMLIPPRSTSFVEIKTYHDKEDLYFGMYSLSYEKIGTIIMNLECNERFSIVKRFFSNLKFPLEFTTTGKTILSLDKIQIRSRFDLSLPGLGLFVYLLLIGSFTVIVRLLLPEIYNKYSIFTILFVVFIVSIIWVIW